MTPAPSPLLPGFIALHGNRAEDLTQALIAWLRQWPIERIAYEATATYHRALEAALADY